MSSKLLVYSDRIEVIYTPDEAVKFNKFSVVHFNRRGDTATLSIHDLPEVLEVFRNIYSANDARLPEKIRRLYLKETCSRRVINELLTNGPLESSVVNEHLTLMRHQQIGREIADVRDRFCFFFDTRTGKTPLSLAIMYDDIKLHPEHKWLVVCPLILIDNAWIADAHEFIPDIKIVSCHAATKAKRLQAMQQQANIYVTNTESFVTYKEYLEKIPFEGCFVDESSSMKSPKSKQSKALVDFAHKLKRFYLLSGTPAPNGEWEYFMQLRAIDYYSVQSSYTKFKNAYFINISYNPQYEKLMMRPDKRDEFMKNLKRHALYVDKEDVLTTPGRTFIDYNIEMPNELKKMYNKMKHELYLKIGDNKEIVVNSAAAKLNKLNQITSGFIINTEVAQQNKIYNENNTDWYLLSPYRFEALYELLNTIQKEDPGQVLIWANYRKEFEILQEHFGDDCRCIYGATSIEDKNMAIKLFKDNCIRYLLANPASADKGLTLTNCHICIYFSLNWSYELFKQSMERIYGDIKKQPKPCKYYIMMANKTIDSILYKEVLQGKETASTAILNHLKEA